MHVRKITGTLSVIIIKEGMLTTDSRIVVIAKNGTITCNLSTSSEEQPVRLRIVHRNIAG